MSVLIITIAMLLAACGSASRQSTPAPTTPVATLELLETQLPANTPEPSFTPFPTETRAPVTVRPTVFDGQQAYAYVEDQMALGARWPGSPGHEKVGDLIVNELQELGWDVEEQTFPYQDLMGRNIIGRANRGAGPIIILGAHYDTRRIANRSPGPLASEPTPGAVDGASGVAVLLELARTLDFEQIDHEIWLAFFDLEDQGSGGMPGFDWIVGSTYMAENLEVRPGAMVLVDMIGDADQQLYYEGNSDPTLNQQIWTVAEELGYGDFFIPELGHTLSADDHLPFIRQGIPAIDIIDLDYPYWHTVEDTADKVGAESLERVGRTLAAWLESIANEAT